MLFTLAVYVGSILSLGIIRQAEGRWPIRRVFSSSEILHGEIQELHNVVHTFRLVHPMTPIRVLV